MLWTYLGIVGMAALPIVELKGAIPFGMAMGVAPWTCFYLALFGSCLPGPFIMWLFEVVYALAKRHNIRLLVKVMDMFVGKAERNKEKVLKYEKFILFGLFIFVAIPLPTTGVWTGAMIATLLRLDWKKAVPVIWAGNVIAGLLIFLVFGSFF